MDQQCFPGMYKRDGGEEQKGMQRDRQTISYDLMPALSSLHRIRLGDIIFMSPDIKFNYTNFGSLFC